MTDWKSWKPWTALGLVAAVLFTIFTFASPEQQPEGVARPVVEDTEARRAPTASRTTPASRETRLAGIESVRLDWLEPQGGSYSIRRNIFSYYVAPIPPPPPPPQPVLPPDRDKDGVPDFRDNCVNAANPDQGDVDGDGIGTACESDPEVAPPPPPPPEPVPPPFTYKYIGTFGTLSNPIATFTGEGELINARVGDVLAGKFILRSIGIESVEIGFTGFPADKRQRIAIGQ